jgi:hypothetical protein
MTPRIYEEELPISHRRLAEMRAEIDRNRIASSLAPRVAPWAAAYDAVVLKLAAGAVRRSELRTCENR